MTSRAMMYDEGLFSARPAASVGNGYVYFATDTGNLYRSDGSSWTLIGSTGGGGGAVSSVFTRTGAVVAVNGDYYGVVAAALTGATAASRYVGATASGAPGSGTFLKGDFIVDQTGAIYVCTVAGSPGTWVAVGSSASFATPAIVLGTAAAAGSAGTVIRSDATIVAFDATAPSTQAFGDTAVVGVAAVSARRDHKHAMPADPFNGAAAGGDLAGTYPNPTVAKVHETSGPTALTIGAIGNGDYLTRSGSSIVGGSPTPGGPPTGAAGGDLTGTYPNPTLAAAGPGATGPIGSASVAPVITIDAKGRVTALTSATIASPTMVVLYENTLLSDTANIDTGAGGIAGGYRALIIYLLVQTDDATGTAAVDITVNNDTGSNYDRMVLSGNNITAAASNTLAQTSWNLNVHGHGGTAAYAALLTLTIPFYTETNFNKIARYTGDRLDATAASNRTEFNALGWRNTAAITRFKVAAVSTAKLKTGTHLVIYGVL